MISIIRSQLDDFRIIVAWEKWGICINDGIMIESWKSTKAFVVGIGSVV